MIIQKHTQDIFPTLIMKFDLSEHPHYKRVLEVVDKTKTGYHMIMKDSESSYSEKTGNAWLDHILLTDFKDALQHCVDEWTSAYGVKKCLISNSWMNRVGVGGAVKTHRHELSVVSGAFYPIADKDSTPLKFKSPLNMYRMHEFLVNETLYTEAHHSVQCNQGELILFPSWLEHYTDDNKTQTRVTVSFNTKYE